jgi:hypothetical protein
MLMPGFFESRHGFLEHIQFAASGHFLWQIAYRTIRRAGYYSAFGLLYSGNNAHQRSFAGTVAPNQSYTVAITNEETHVAEQVIAGKMYG